MSSSFNYTVVGVFQDTTTASVKIYTAGSPRATRFNLLTMIFTSFRMITPSFLRPNSRLLCMARRPRFSLTRIRTQSYY